MHFTTISSIAATYKFTVNAGVGGAVTGDNGELLVPLLGSSAEENPTISIAPMQGEEFTQRLLTPFQEQKLTLLLRQGYDVDSLLRLMGAEVRLEDGSGVSRNRPADPGAMRSSGASWLTSPPFRTTTRCTSSRCISTSPGRFQPTR